MEEVELETVKPPTLEEIEAIRQDAYNEGFATGERDGFHAGQLKARQEAEEALKERLQSLERLMTQLLEPIAEQDALIEQGMVNLVNHVARQVIQRELHMDSSHVRQVLREALKLLPMGAANIRIHVNPQDFERVGAARAPRRELADSRGRFVAARRLPHRDRTQSHRRDHRDAPGAAVKQLFEQQREQATHPLASDIRIDLDAPETSMRLERTSFARRLEGYTEAVSLPAQPVVEGRLLRMVGLTLEAEGLQAAVGSRCNVINESGYHPVQVEAEVMGFSGSKVYLMPVGSSPASRLARGSCRCRTPGACRWACRCSAGCSTAPAAPSTARAGCAPKTGCRWTARRSTRSSATRSANLDVGIRSINGLLTVGRGQRLGLFAGTGVGKSVLLGMMTRFTRADIIVVGLIGERVAR